MGRKIQSAADAERARCVKVCMDTAGMLIDAGDCDGANGARMCAETLGLLTPAVESDTTAEDHARGDAATTALDAIAKLCGCPRWDYPGQVVRDVGALATERDAAREIIAGRDRAPTDAEVEVHAKAGGSWLGYSEIGPYGFDRSEVASHRDRVARWWPLDASGAPCAWPVVTP